MRLVIDTGEVLEIEVGVDLSGRDFLVAFSCKGRGVCPSCNARRMAESLIEQDPEYAQRRAVRKRMASWPRD